MQNLSKNFLEKLNFIYSKEEIKIIEEWFKTPNPTVFRINTLKTDFDALEELRQNWFELEKIPYLSNSYKILKNWDTRISETKSFKEGYIYLQWITSQIPVELAKIPDNLKNFKALDLTAAPGWKTSQLACKMKNNWEIIANELNKIRFEKLSYTIKNQQVKNTKLLNKDARELKNIFKKESFDLIIADLPCSAEWRINLEKEKTYKYLEKPWINKRNYKLQQDILKNTIDLLKTGWELIYSTCTLDPLENEGIVHYILSNFKNLEVSDISSFFNQKWLKEISKPWIKKYKKYIFRNEVSKAIRLLPSKETEWFFVVKFKKVSF